MKNSSDDMGQAGLRTNLAAGLLRSLTKRLTLLVVIRVSFGSYRFQETLEALLHPHLAAGKPFTCRKKTVWCEPRSHQTQPFPSCLGRGMARSTCLVAVLCKLRLRADSNVMVSGGRHICF